MLNWVSVTALYQPCSECFRHIWTMHEHYSSNDRWEYNPCISVAMFGKVWQCLDKCDNSMTISELYSPTSICGNIDWASLTIKMHGHCSLFSSTSHLSAINYRILYATAHSLNCCVHIWRWVFLSSKCWCLNNTPGVH